MSKSVSIAPRLHHSRHVLERRVDLLMTVRARIFGAELDRAVDRVRAATKVDVDVTRHVRVHFAYRVTCALECPEWGRSEERRGGQECALRGGVGPYEDRQAVQGRDGPAGAWPRGQSRP